MFEPFRQNINITWQQYQFFSIITDALNNKCSRKIAVRSGHGVGKSASLAMLILYYLFMHPNCQVPATSPTSYQLHDVLWKEINLWISKMPEAMREYYIWSTDYVRMAGNENTWFARAKTARKEQPEALAGVHAPFVLLGVDEASGVPDECFDAAKSSLTNKETLFVMISNPTRLTGYFYDAFHKNKDEWVNLHFNSEESPIVDHKFTDDIIKEHGTDSEEYRVRVRGDFPKSDAMDESGYVPLLTVNDIIQVPDIPFFGYRRLGVDCAGEGKDESVWVVRDDFKAKIVCKEKLSTQKTIAVRTLTLMKHYDIKPNDVYVDNFGVGANVAQELGLLGYRVNAVNVGQRPNGDDDRAKFINMRAQIAWQLKEWIRRGAELIEHEGWQELLHVRYKADLSGKLKIMSKDEMRREGIDSPDCYDALALTFWDGERTLLYKSRAVIFEEESEFSAI